MELQNRQHLIDSTKDHLTTALTNKKKNDVHALRSSIQHVLNELNNNSQTETPLDYLLDVGEDFFNRLRNQWPNLTPKQERLCGLLRAGLNSKQIGIILGLKPEGVKGQRKRLRKALDMKQSQKLEKVIGEV